MKRLVQSTLLGRLMILVTVTLALSASTVVAAPSSSYAAAGGTSSPFAVSSAAPPPSHPFSVAPRVPVRPPAGHDVARFPTRQVWRTRQGHKTTSTSQGAASTSSPQGSGNLVWNNGPIHETPASYAIFWGPSWSNGSGGLTSDGQIAQNFLADTGGTSFEAILSQYYDATAHIAITQNVAGVYLDSSTPPSDTSCGGATIEDSNIQQEISTAIAAKSWTPDAANATFFVYTPNGYFVNDGTGACSEQIFCAYHSWSNIANVAYAAMPYPTDLSSCGVPTAPNGNQAGDTLANTTSFELFETITDPQIGTGWMDAAGFEIADKCAYDFSAGTTLLANGHTYDVQTEYSNATSTCVTQAQAHMQATPSALSLTTSLGVSPNPQALTLANTGVVPLNWSLTSTLPAWLAVSPTSGTVAAGASESITLTFSTTSTTPQVYSTTLTFADPSADNSPLSVPVTVSSAAHMQVSPASVSLTTVPGTSPAAQTLTLQNTGTVPLNWSLTSTLPAWLAVSPTSGTVAAGASAPLTLTFNTPSTTPQTYTTTLTFSDPNADNSPLSVPVTVISGYPHFQVTPASITLTTAVGTTPAPQTLSLANTGVAALHWNLTSTLPAWLAVSPASGTLSGGSSQTLTLAFSISGTTPQVYSTTLTFADPNADNSPLSVPVSVTTTSLLPALWTDQDIGNVGLGGSAQYSKGTFTVKSAGADIWNTADGFNFLYRPLTGDGDIVARVVSLSNTDPWAKAGVMIRGSLDPAAPSVSMIVSYSNGLWNIIRSVSGAAAYQVGGASGCCWVKLERHGSTFTTYVSSNGQQWAQVNTVSVPMATNVYMGLAVSSHNTSALNTATFDNVEVSSPPYFQATPAAVYATTAPGNSPAAQMLTLTNTGASALNWSLTPTLPTWLSVSPASGKIASQASQTLTLTFSTPSSTPQRYATSLTFNDPHADNAPFSVPVTVDATTTPIPSPWADLDIGAPGVTGSATYANGTFTVAGSGSDIFNTSDQFNFMYQPLTGDGEIVARVTGEQDTNSWAKAGVMMRETLTPTSTDAFIFISWSNGTQMTVRNSTGASTGSANGPLVYGTYWVKLVRAGNFFTSSVSSDGVTWTQVSVQAIVMTGTIYVGLAVTARNNSALNTATFDNVAVTVPPYAHMQIAPTSISLSTGVNTNPSPQTLTLTNSGQTALRWSVGSTVPSWLAVSPTSGTLNGGASSSLTLTFSTASTTSQTYSTNLLFSDPSADNSPITVPVEVEAVDPGTGTYASAVLNDQPLRYYHLGEMRGATDLGSLNQRGTYIGNVTVGATGLITGDSDTAATFDGTSGAVSFPLNGLPTGNSPWTLEAWFSAPAVVTGYENILTFGSECCGEAAIIGINPSNQVFAGTYGADTSGTGYTVGARHYLVGTWDGSTLRCYLDGALVSSASLSPRNLTLTGGHIGARNTTLTEFFRGTIDDAAIYNYALSATQVQSHYNVGTGASQSGSYASIVLADNPLHYYRLDDTSTGATNAIDSSGNAQSGMYSGGVVTTAGLITGSSNTAMAFDGASGVVNVPDAGLPTGSQPWSLEAWCTPVTTADAQTVISLGSGGGNGYSAAVMTRSGGWWIWGWGSGYDSPVWGTVVSGTTYYLVATYDGTTERLYINGTLAGSFTVSKNVQPYATIGQSGNGSGNPFHGVIDEAAIYNYPLSATQVQNHYNAGIGVVQAATPQRAPATRGALSLGAVAIRAIAATGPAMRASLPSGSSLLSPIQSRTLVASVRSVAWVLRPGVHQQSTFVTWGSERKRDFPAPLNAMIVASPQRIERR